MIELGVIPNPAAGVIQVIDRLAGWYCFRTDLSNRWDGHDSQAPIAIRFEASDTITTSFLAVEIRADFGMVVLYLDPGLVDHASDMLLPGWRDENVEALPRAWRATHVLSHLSSGMHIDLTEAMISVADGLCILSARQRERLLVGSVELNEQIYAIRLDLSSIEPCRALALLPPAAPNRLSLLDPGFSINLSLGTRRLDVADAAALGPGDILLLQDIQDGILTLQGTVGSVLSFTGRIHLDGGGLVIQDAMRMGSTMQKVNGEEVLLDQNPGDTDPIEETEPLLKKEDLPSIPVALDFKLSSTRVSLSELAAIGIGTTLNLGMDLTETIAVEANGMTIGFGHLVQVDDQLGVQIARWTKRPGLPDD